MTSAAHDPAGRPSIEAVAFSAANSGAYLSAVFAGYRSGNVVLALPRGSTARKVQGVTILERHSFEDAPGWFSETLEPIRTDAPAQISFSSGTTGRPKAILLSHRTLSDVVERINTAMGVDETIREYIGVPVTFSFGFGRARAVATAGGQSYLPKNGFDPAEIARMLEAGEINAISAVPTLWRVVLANPEVIGKAGEKVRWIEIGSQYMSGDEKAAMKALFPNAKIVQHYGLTEASRTTLLDISATKGKALESVGKPAGDVEVAIAEDGAIRIRGPHVAEGLVSGTGLKPVTDDDGWLTTADKGRLAGGYLYYEGRMDELINSGGIKIDPTQFEQRLLAGLGVGDGLAVGRIPDALRGERVLVAIATDAGLDRALVEDEARKVAEGYGLAGGGSLTFREVAEIPRTATGKVQRNQLADLPEVSAKAPAATGAGDGAAAGKAAELQALWAEVLGAPDVSIHESFYDLGGDSLSALTTIMRMEAMGIDAETARGIFEGKTIAELTGASSIPADAAPVASARATPAAAPAAASGKAAELQALWAEVLGAPDVSIHESFYDLGGDSLSALTTIMRMEAIGIDAETARGIFEGKTIAELTGGSETTAAPASGKAAELQKLWAEILGAPDVSIDQSFYDLGGDSLSALTAIMRMETIGIDAETARGIFEGKTIRDLVGEDAPAPDPFPEPVAPRETVAPRTAAEKPAEPVTGPVLTFAEMMNAVHATRGLLILWVVVVHWLPGVLERLPGNPVWLYDAINPALRYGTPGFAMVFGLGVGALGVHHFSNNPTQFYRGNKFNVKLILGGVLFMALFRIATLMSGGSLSGPHVVSYVFYSAVAFYALAMLTLPWVMRLLVIGPNWLMNALLISVVCMGIHEVLGVYVAPLAPGGLLELIKILITAKYGYFHMMSYVMVGVAMGILLRQYFAHPRLIRTMLTYGAMLAIFGLVVLWEVRGNPDLTQFDFVHPWHLFIYAGVTLGIIAAFCAINRGGTSGLGTVLRQFNGFAISSGILALPIFIGHEVVIPAKSLLANLGLPGPLAMLIPLAIFLGGLAILYRRLMRFFGR